MNLHLPQSLETKAEVSEIAMVPRYPYLVNLNFYNR